MVRLAAIDHIEDQTVLKEISSSDPDISIRRAALKKISEAGTKAQIAQGGRDGAGDSRRQKLTVDDVVELKRVGAANDLIIGQIKKSAPGYDISKNDLVRLFDAGVSTDIIRAMVQRSEEPRETSETENRAAQPGSLPGAWPLDLGENRESCIYRQFPTVQINGRWLRLSTRERIKHRFDSKLIVLTDPRIRERRIHLGTTRRTGHQNRRRSGGLRGALDQRLGQVDLSRAGAGNQDYHQHGPP